MRLTVAWHNLLSRPVQTGLTVLVTAVAVALMITVSLFANGLHNGLIRATEPFDLIVGAKGSPNQLVLNTVFLQDSPIANIDYAHYEQLAANPLVAAAIPLAFGDNYQGYRIVGASQEIFRHKSRSGQPDWLQLADGQYFQHEFEAVVGAKAARELQLRVGDEFTSVHGLIPGGETHARPYRVVGVLQPVHGPYDQAIIVDINSIWEAHAGHDHSEAAGDDHDQDTLARHAHPPRAVTAVLVKPNGYSEAMRLYQQFQHEPAAQMIFPAQVIVKLFAVLGQGQTALALISYAITGMGLIIMALSLYWSALSRERERAILRALGAGCRDIAAIIVIEAFMLAASGAVLGAIAGHSLYWLLAAAMTGKTAITLATGFIASEAYILLISIVLGVSAGMIPAAMTYRSDIGRQL
ncbi:MAG: ABC transporter permease [Sporomusaceae bacterium]|nr:ABC transporter permease [Sporomusaceae bacterium]